MRKDLSFYNCDDEQFAPRGIERTEVLKNISRNDFVAKHLDHLFGEYIAQLIKDDQEKATGSDYQHNLKYRSIQMLTDIQSIFSQISFGKLICNLESESISNIIINPNEPLSEEQIIKLIGRLQFFIDNFLNKEGITNFYLHSNDISDSPY